MFKRKFPYYRQLDMMDCGPTCLKMIAKFHGKDYATQKLREVCHVGKQGSSLLGISDGAEQIGLRTISVKSTYELLVNEAPLPAIAHWRQNHFVVVYQAKDHQVKVADPAIGMINYTKEEFCQYWVSTRDQEEKEGILLLLEPTPEFYEDEIEEAPPRQSLRFLYRYLIPHRSYILQLILGMVAGSIISLIFPFLMQALIDFGVNQQDLEFVYILLLAQLMLFGGKMAIDLLRGWILLHVATRINISIISDFLSKMMRLSISFFDSKNLGDILQRIRDHDRIETFLTSSSLEVLFSLVNLVIFSLVLLVYDVQIFLAFCLGTALYVLWIFFFLRKRKQIDYKRFNQLANSQGNEVQLVQGMQEIKLNNCEKQKRWEWERIQAQLFKINIKGLALNQYQNSGAFFINEIKNIFITFLAARGVIQGDITLGVMLAISYILGQLNAPVIQLINFILGAQDAKISLERLSEIHNRPDEEEQTVEALHYPQQADIILENVSFRYQDPNNPWILKDLNLVIPFGKTTAIVGPSGSGKTTLLKLLLKFYEPERGKIKLGNTLLRNVNTSDWRARCGTVMQDGFIFSDTIARNIAPGQDHMDKEMLLRAVDIANIKDFIESLPLNYNTKIGAEGLSLSQGQKQRILIARSIYKQPDFFFFDEATSSLDANNEYEITLKLHTHTQGKTNLIIAHRLSTVKTADQIIVLEKGEVREQGTHLELVSQNGIYYDLVKNQLELGN